MSDFIISASILGATPLNIDKEMQKIKSVNIKWIHFDVMDGKFVKNTSFEDDFLDEVCNGLNLVKDVHIMIDNPYEEVERYAKCGADYLTFHYEACKDDAEVKKVIDKIHSFNMKAGLSIKPNTPIEKISPFIKDLDLVLVMSVEPGYGGQSFINSSTEKISSLRKIIDEENPQILLSVDGGINDKTAPICLSAGADVLVVGRYLFGRDDYLERFQRLVK